MTRYDPRDFDGRLELPSAFAGFGGNVPHQVFVGVTEQVVTIGIGFANVVALVDLCSEIWARMCVTGLHRVGLLWGDRLAW
ncbi:hypothetical protein [Allorhodopirellula solitaria]